MLCGMCSALIAVSAIVSPPVFASGKFLPHGHGSLPSGNEAWGKPHYPPSGPHPDDTVNKPTMKNRITNQ
ncbi:hypothetical protein DID96_09915 [Burkholderia sp. Bp8963]|nr:hypothetical protein DID96_09915 [Burkholderia sp. Bp8963]